MLFSLNFLPAFGGRNAQILENIFLKELTSDLIVSSMGRLHAFHSTF